MLEQLPIYEVLARNTSADSENKIHDDIVAAGFGFSGGLVPGVTVFGYLTVPVVARFPEWLERGSMRVRFEQPFYEGDPVLIRASCQTDGSDISIDLRAEKRNGTAGATASAIVPSQTEPRTPPLIPDYETRLAAPSFERLAATREALIPGMVLVTLVERLDLIDCQRNLLKQIGEKLPLYYGEAAVAHPVVILGMANRMLVHNVELGPWIHVSSDLTNFSTAHDGEEISVTGLIAEQFERKGHEFVVLDLLLAAGDRLVQKVRHTAIYRIRRQELRDSAPR